MRLCVIGSGYVGLVAGTCFADYGNHVYCVDIDEKKIEKLKNGVLPIYEPGLSEMVVRNQRQGRMECTTDLEKAVKDSDIIFIAVGTPDGGDGRADLTGVLRAAHDAGKYSNGYKIIVTKSTVPIGTARRITETVQKNTSYEFDVVSNPEFLREGRAIDDFMMPERIIIGADSEKAGKIMKELYAPFVRESNNPVLLMSVASAELTKYACNAFLAMKISFANEIANLCDELGASYADVKQGLGSDSRIGNKFLNAGIGYGGSCFPKDVRALVQISRDAGLSADLLDEIENTNNRQKIRLVELIKNHYKNTGERLEDLRLAVWGLAFKPGTDDMRDAPSIDIIKSLMAQGASLQAHDPVAVDASRPIFGEGLAYGAMYDILKNADALLILTEWTDFLEPDFSRIRSLLKKPVIFDGRNIYKPQSMKEAGFVYYGIGGRS